jgi:hypothetical protein
MEKDPSGVWFSYSTAAIIADETSPGAQKSRRESRLEEVLALAFSESRR